jgi:hypothetical protein
LRVCHTCLISKFSDINNFRRLVGLWKLAMRSILFFSSVAFLAKWALAQSDVCYFANGTALPDDDLYNEYKPCTSGGPSTICCGVNRANPAGGNDTDGNTRDECLPSGLCQNRVTIAGVEITKYVPLLCSLAWSMC